MPGEIIRTITELRQVRERWRQARRKIALVPTMGALHEGHLSLVRLAKKHADQVIVSIFVNPLQFGPNEDFERYPRDPERDCAYLSEEGVDLVYLPGMEEMYPQGAATTIVVEGVSQGLCGAHRPGHFNGVATVVAKLFHQVQPHLAVFGEKDYQQLMVIRQIVRDLNIPVEIIGAPIVRDGHGLALSSRNAYLSDRELAIAQHLNKVLLQLARDLKGAHAAPVLEKGRKELEHLGFDQVEYLDVRDLKNFQTLEVINGPARLLAAVRLGPTRLIDNVAVE
jgi:pantoate--beta-alanine ligase